MHVGIPWLWSATFLQATMGSSVWETVVVPIEISHLPLLNFRKEYWWMQENVRGDCSAFYFRGEKGIRAPGYMFHASSPESLLRC